jgi:penicillin-binding protein 1C
MAKAKSKNKPRPKKLAKTKPNSKPEKSPKKRRALLSSQSPDLIRTIGSKNFISKFKKRKIGKVPAILITAALAINLWLFWGIPLPTQLGRDPIVSTKIFDRSGQLIYEFFDDQKRDPVKLEELPDHVKKATVAIEDKDFYSHYGFSPMGMLRATYKTVFEGKLEGGSTLTQQLVKNSLLTPERTVRRKAQEFLLASIVELRFSKDEILEMYLNQIPYGSTAYGIGSASELYFGKEAKDLTLAEATLLAGLPQRPTAYSPFGSQPELARQRQQAVLRRMVEDGYITETEASEASEIELNYAEIEAPKAPHFALWVRETLAEKYGDSVVDKGGLRVTTTLDLDLQEYAQEVVAEEVEELKDRDVGNGAALVTRPSTGEILAMVGSKDYFADDEDGKVNIIFTKRQPGSSIKPLNYALALKDKKITPSTPLADIPTCFSVVGQPPYCPVNYDGQFHGSVQTRFALGNSYNIPAVRVLALNGLENFVKFANDMGITTFENPGNYGLSLTLGGGEVRPFDMAVAFGVLANQGTKAPLKSIIKIEDWKGKVLFELDQEAVKDEAVRILDPDVPFLISQMLLDNNARLEAFGGGSFLNVSGHPEVSVKTGTTNDRRDNWTIGYTKLALVVTWVGNNDNTPMSGAVSGVSGASPIWNRIMKDVLDKAEDGAYSEDDKAHAWPQQPDGVAGASICANTGSLPNEHTADCPTRFEYFLEGTVPTGNATRQDINVWNDTGAVANDEALPEQVHMENHLIITDPLGTQICLDCAGPTPQVTVRYTTPKRDN